MAIDPTTPVGKIRLRVGDFQDLPLLSEAVYESALADCENNIPKAATLCAQYILAILTQRTHQRLQAIEIYGNQQYENYLSFLKTTILNPNLMTLAPIPYAGTGDATHPLIQFMSDWNANFANGTQSQDMSYTAIGAGV